MELDRKLIPERERGEYHTRFDMRSLLRGDLDSRREYYASAIQNGFMSINEVSRPRTSTALGKSVTNISFRSTKSRWVPPRHTATNSPKMDQANDGFSNQRGGPIHQPPQLQPPTV